MFERFYATKKERTTPTKPALPANTHAVYDSQTNQELFRGDYAACEAYLTAFGMCLIKPLNV